ncbi:MAG: hypothetical protein RMJ28_06950 [Nitrososphaerota archaeon]|nr:hypothetical protein [Candidatus Calditenuaceae archaeon]MDW8073951.1 hypothetical protein [Nitrososphaerota archaeon]
MSRENFSAIVDVRVEKSADAGGDAGEFIGFFEGVASTPAYDLEGDRFSEDVLRRNAERLAGKPIMLIHGRDSSVGPVAVGKILEARYVDGMLRIKAGIFRAFESVWRRVREGFLKALSIGGLIRAFRRVPGGGREILDAEITEVSLTPRGVNPEARVVYAFGKSYRVEDGILTACEEHTCVAAEALAEQVAMLRSDVASLRELVEPLLAVGKSAERRPKALVSGLYNERRESRGEPLFTPVFDEVWERVAGRRASQSYKNSGA